MIQFILEESLWRKLSNNDDVEDSVVRLLALADCLTPRKQCGDLIGCIAYHEDFYSNCCLLGYPLHEVLFDPDNSVLERDLAHAFMLLLERSAGLSLEPLMEDPMLSWSNNYEMSYGLYVAYKKVENGELCAVLPVVREDNSSGVVAVELEGVKCDVYFVKNESGFREFFRMCILREPAERETFERYAYWAFPSLRWVDNVWSELKDLSKPLIDIRADVIKHLGVLNDKAAQEFRTYQSANPAEIGPRLTALGIPCSDENGKARKDKRARMERTRTYNGDERTFWWHSKIEPNKDRIHFLYDSEDDCIVIGLFTEHCWLP